MAYHRVCGATVLVWALVVPSGLRGQSVIGTVVDDVASTRVSAVRVMLLDSSNVAVARAESDSTGQFLLIAPRIGTYRVHAARVGYDDLLSDTFPLETAGPVELLIRMVPDPFELEGMEVVGEGIPDSTRRRLEAQGFFTRRENSGGYFLDAAEIEQLHPRYVTDLVRQVPGVRLLASRDGNVVSSLRSYKPVCAMKVVLDGYKVDNLDGGVDFLVNPDLVVGIEVYPGAGGVGAPVQHRGTDAFCGIVMIWTR